MKLHVNGGHALALQPTREVADSERNNMPLITCVYEVLASCEVCQASEKAPHVPAAGTSTVAMFNEKLQADLLFLDDVIALHIMDVYSKYSLSYRFALRIPRRFGTPSAALGLGFLVLLGASSWAEAGKGRMNCRRNYVPNVASNFSRCCCAPHGFSNAAMVWPVESIID